MLCSPLRPGQISEVVARIYLGAPPSPHPPHDGNDKATNPTVAAEVDALGTASTSDPDPGVAFSIPYESNLND